MSWLSIVGNMICTLSILWHGSKIAWRPISLSIANWLMNSELFVQRKPASERLKKSYVEKTRL